MPKQKISLNELSTRVALVILAVFLQVQLTLFASGDYVGLRVNAADLILPIAGLLILASLVFKKSSWPHWQKPFGYWAPILLSIVVGLALLNGYRIQGEWSNWALVNKGLGWLVLMAYLSLGAWLASNKAINIHNWFIRPFFGFLILITISEIILRNLFYTHLGQPFVVFNYDFGFDLSGLMANRNAFAFLYLSALVFGTMFLSRKRDIQRIDAIGAKTLWFLLPAFFALNASRSILLILVPVIIYLLITNWRLFAKAIMPLILIGLIILPFTNLKRFQNAASYLTTFQEQSISLVSGQSDSEAMEDNVYVGDALRVQILKDSIDFYKEHPITGAGIGTIYEHQKTQTDRRFVAIIDNTPLWVFAEMGPFGFLAFGTVFFSMLIALHRKSKDLDTHDQVFAHAMIFVLIGFGLFSLFHEILYTRFLWVFLGMSLAVPAISKRQNG